VVDQVTDHLVADERRKYAKMWSKPQYRINSPGLNVAPAAAEWLWMEPGGSVIDYGCGEGKALDWFNANGYHATGVDIISLRPDVIEVCLWSLPETLSPSDYGFCADVMEHMPPERVDDVLAGIRARTRKAAFFSVANSECTVGKRHGETLHLTRQPVEWWAGKVRQYWPRVEVRQGDREWRYSIAAWN
jgi:SAM-dependent methyltransferase